MSLQRHRRRLAGSERNGETFSNEDLRNAISDGASFKDCTFRKCKLGQASFRGAFFSGCHFEDCDLRQAILVCRFLDTTFVGCDLDQAVFHSSIIERTYFERCRLEYAVFSRATLIGGGLLDCQLHGAYLDMAESEGVDFTGSNLWGAVMPMSCAMIPGNRFDHRQVHMLLALASKAILDEKDGTLLRSATEPMVMKLVERLIARQSDETKHDQGV